MTMHCDRFLVNKTNRCTNFQLYWYYNSTRFGHSAHHQEFYPHIGIGTIYAGAPGITQSPKLHKSYQRQCMARTPDDGQKDCPKHVEL
jgi:hypothetical protein